jgi:uncharacterized membrane-anchored protein
MKKLLKISAVALAVLPGIAFASDNPLLDIITKVGQIVNTIIPILLAAAVAYFFWGVIQYAFLAKDDASKKTARGIMVYGIIGLFVMVAVWGLVNMLKTFTGTSNAPTSVQAPGITP